MIEVTGNQIIWIVVSSSFIGGMIGLAIGAILYYRAYR